MDNARLFEILTREHKKLEEGGVEWLREYASNAQRDLGFTFYMICKVLGHSTQNIIPSKDLQKKITRYMTDANVQFYKKWNPVDWFSARWVQPGSGSTQDFVIGRSETNFDPEYAEIINRDKQKVWRMWLAPQYAAEVREFFGVETQESPVHKEAQPVNQQESPLTALGRELFWDPPEMMEEVDQLLRDKPQLIFYGPPGTGKTFVARALAKHLMGGEEPAFLQFHPSYSYEDFFEGFRPVRGRNRGMPQFALVPGPLKKIAQKAAADPLRRFVLVIDEINRGNLAKIFGELYFLLEYRDQEMMLQYGGQPFSLPNNLLIIGTMNTADRSISHIDAALRRRFHFFPLFPNEEPIKGLLERYLVTFHADKHKQLEWIAEAVNVANKDLGNRDNSIGHSYFIRDDLDESWAELIWKHDIMPLIEDRFIDQSDRVKELEFERLRSRLREERGREAV